MSKANFGQVSSSNKQILNHADKHSWLFAKMNYVTISGVGRGVST
jgi:hypothetical protein